eukprot:2317185-Alexandrium_andersonii.AAC.1
MGRNNSTPWSQNAQRARGPSLWLGIGEHRSPLSFRVGRRSRRASLAACSARSALLGGRGPWA